MPLYITSSEYVPCARLRLSNIDAADGSVEERTRIAARLRGTWPKERIIIRGDSGFCREEIMAWCEAEGVEFVLGLAKNSRLNALTLRWRGSGTSRRRRPKRP